MVPEVAPTLNKMLRAHWSERKKQKDRWRMLILEALRGHRPLFDDHDLIYDRGWCGRRADWDNVGASLKPILDALTDLRIIPDDSPKYIKSVTLKQTRYRKRRDRKTILVFRDGK